MQSMVGITLADSLCAGTMTATLGLDPWGNGLCSSKVFFGHTAAVVRTSREKLGRLSSAAAKKAVISSMFD